MGQVTPSGYPINNDYTSNYATAIVNTYTDITATDPYCSGDTGEFISGSYDFDYYVVGDAIKMLSDFDGYNFYVRASGNGLLYLHYYEPPTTSGTLVVETDDILEYTPFEYNDDNLINQVIIVGNKGNLYEYSDDTSISKYGRHPKRINDPRIKTEYDASSSAYAYIARCKTPVLKGSVTIEGDVSVDLNQKFSLSIPEINISGAHEIVAYTHTIDARGFTTKLDLGRTFRDPSNLRDTAITSYVESFNEEAPGEVGSVVYKSGNGYGGESAFKYDSGDNRLDVSKVTLSSVLSGTSMKMSGDISSATGIYTTFVSASTTNLTGDPGGSDKQIQFNDNGTLTGDTSMTWDKTANNLYIAGGISGTTISGGSLKLTDNIHVSTSIFMQPTVTAPTNNAGMIWMSGTVDYCKLYMCTSNSGVWKSVDIT